MAKLTATLWTKTDGIGNCDCGQVTDMKWKIGAIKRFICYDCAKRDYKLAMRKVIK